jgi:hypothetical protein
MFDNLKIQNINKYINFFTIIILFAITIACGFLFGYKYREGQISKEIPIIHIDKPKDTSIEAKIVDGVQFIKANNPKVCDSVHPIKGTFNNDGGNFYNQSNKQYDRIKPDICFASEDFALNVAGFIKKY